MAERDLQGLRAMAEGLTGKFEQIRANIGDMQRAIREVTGTATSTDGFVKATVGPRGQLIKLDLNARIYRNPDTTKLANIIVETVKKAGEEATAKVKLVTDKYAPGMGAESYLKGDLAARLSQFDFAHDEIEKADD